MSWNIFRRLNIVEVRTMVTESNLSQLQHDLHEALTRIQVLEQNIPRTLSEAEVKRRLKAAAYSRAYYKNKKAMSAAKDAP
jgi:hypothetical protein